MATLLELLAKLDSNIQVRGHQFEYICKWYLESDPKYRLELKKVWLWKDWPGKWGPDAGIDLVGKTYDNKLWAIQAKAYDKQYSIKKTDIDTFLSESSRQVFSYRLLIATTNFIGRTALRTLGDQEKPVGRVLFSDLQKSQVEWPESPHKLVAKPLKRKKPLLHQQKAISDVLKGFSKHDRGQLIMACGTGKTLVALWVAEKLQSQRTLVLLPSLSLLAQTLREWTANTSQSFHYLPVCSDDTVRGEDRLVSKTSDLGLPVTTDPEEISSFLRHRGHILVFATYQSSPVIAEAFTKDRVPAFDLAIADEAHRCAGPGSGPFATILDATTIKAKRRLFMTATPRYFTDRVRKEAEVVDFEIASMDDDNKFGPVFHQLSFSEAIEKDLLSGYQVVIVGVDDPTYRKFAEQGTFVTTDGKEVTDARTLASHIALAKAMHKYDLKRIISFHGRIKRAKEFSNQLVDVIKWMPENARPNGNLWSRHVTGEMPSGRRDALLNRFRHLEDGERGLLSNARCLSEGIDLPTLDGVAFIDPRSSQIDIVQAVGRAIRKSPDKKVGTVILPIFIDTDMDAEIALDSSIFKPVWNVLKALRAHDAVLSETLDKLRHQLGRYGNKGLLLPKNLFIDLPVTVGKSFAESLTLRLVEKSTASWEFWFGLLQNYVETNSDALIPQGYKTDDGFRLGAWVGNQRLKYRKGQLDHKKQEMLGRLPGWTWDPCSDQWQEGYNHLNIYVKREGDALVPAKYKNKEGFTLGRWVRTNRKTQQAGKLSKERQKVLEQLPFWQWNPFKTKWLQGLEPLHVYVEQEGHASVPRKYITKDGYKLGQWVGIQMAAYKRGKLSSERQMTLEKLPAWTWNPNVDQWIEGFTRMREYVEQKGDAVVPHSHVTEDGFNLGSWVARQRRVYQQGKLSKERKKSLEELPGWPWKLHIGPRLDDARWHECFKLLQEYVKREGNSLVPARYVTDKGYKLGVWVARQLQDYRKGKLSKERKMILVQLPHWTWDPLETAWLQGFKHLQSYLECQRHTLVPVVYVTQDGYNLGRWVQQQRGSYKRGKLSTERQNSLEQLPDWTWKVKKTL